MIKQSVILSLEGCLPVARIIMYIPVALANHLVHHWNRASDIPIHCGIPGAVCIHLRRDVHMDLIIFRERTGLTPVMIW